MSSGVKSKKSPQSDEDDGSNSNEGLAGGGGGNEGNDLGDDQDQDRNQADISGNTQGASEFVRKLFRMLEDKQVSSVVSWSESGESFVIHDQNEFSKHVLPNHFKHNNFASFVRQLNKYDFHKVKMNEPKSKGVTELMWEFKHPSFTRNGADQLSVIKRKNTKKNKDDSGPKSAEELQQQVDTLGAIQKDMANYLQTLSRNYESVVREVIMFKRNMAAQDQLIQNLLQYLVSKEMAKPEMEGHKKQATLEGLASLPQLPSSHSTDLQTFQIPSSNPQPVQLQQQIQMFQQIQQQQQQQQQQQPQLPIPSSNPMRQPIQDLQDVTPQNLNWQVPPEAISGNFDNFQNVAQMSFAQMEELSKKARTDSQLKTEEALTVHSVGMLRPRPEDQQNASNSVRVIRKTFVPAWSVPPKVLVVEDDDASRRLASKFLQIMGCTYEIAQDGMEAVNKMNLAKYDLVLMDIVMPQLDGVSATTQIRQFDSSTPVISMTSNTSREDCIEYLSNGMNDILPKPFSRDSLRAMLEHYCSHLKTHDLLPQRETEYPDPNEPAAKRARYADIQSG